MRHMVWAFLLVACRRESDTSAFDDSDGVDTADDAERFTAVAVATGDAGEGALAIIDIDSFGLQDDVARISPDASLFVKDTVLFAAERAGADRVRGWGVGDWDTVYFDVALGAGAEPRSVELCINRIWVGMAGRPYLQGYTWGAEDAGQIDLSSYADADGLPEVESLLLTDGTFYAAVHRHDATGSAGDDAQVLQIDCPSHSVMRAWPTLGKEPALGPYGIDPSKVLVREGQWAPDGEVDGDLAVLSPNAGTWKTIVHATELGGEISAFGSRGRLGMLANHAPEGGTDLACVDLTTSHVQPATHVDGQVLDIAVDDRERAWVAITPADGAPDAQVQVWHLDDCTPRAGAIRTRLPPRSIAFYHQKDAE